MTPTIELSIADHPDVTEANERLEAARKNLASLCDELREAKERQKRIDQFATDAEELAAAGAIPDSEAKSRRKTAEKSARITERVESTHAEQAEEVERLEEALQAAETVARTEYQQHLSDVIDSNMTRLLKALRELEDANEAVRDLFKEMQHKDIKPHPHPWPHPVRELNQNILTRFKLYLVEQAKYDADWLDRIV